MVTWGCLSILLLSAACAANEVASLSRLFQDRNTSLSDLLGNLGLDGNGLQSQPGGNAEDNAQYLWNVFKHKSTMQFSKRFITNPTNIPNTGAFKGKGMYMFFFKCNQKDTNYYPIYYGFTDEGFRNRMTHSGSEHTVPKMIKSGQFKAPGGCDPIEDNLFWVLIQCTDHLVSKFLESGFLGTFNFALNDKENRPKRTTLTIPRNQVATHVSQHHLYNVLEASVKFFNQYIQHQDIP